MSVHKIGGAISLHQARSQKQQAEHMDKQFRRAANTYEKHFLREIVKAMRSTVKHSKITSPSMAEKIYKEKLDNEYVESWGAQGGIGLGEIIYTQLKDRFGHNSQMRRPQGPISVQQKSSAIRIDESHEPRILPVKTDEVAPQTKMNFIIELDPNSKEREVTAPWSGTVTDMISSEEGRHTIKIKHEDDMASTISYRGPMQAFRRGDSILAGQRLGQLLPEAGGLTWGLEHRA